jgi:hypothetical protein
LAATAWPASGSARTAVKNCGTLTIEPAGSRTGALGGAACLYRAYQQHCLAAVYRLSTHGVDTVATDRFELVRGATGCRIAISISFQVIPQKPSFRHGRCSALKRTRSDVLATGCRGNGIPRSISLRGRPS